MLALSKTGNAAAEPDFASKDSSFMKTEMVPAKQRSVAAPGLTAAGRMLQKHDPNGIWCENEKRKRSRTGKKENHARR
jgi:hypothetical protein